MFVKDAEVVKVDLHFHLTMRSNLVKSKVVRPMDDYRIGVTVCFLVLLLFSSSRNFPTWPALRLEDSWLYVDMPACTSYPI